MEGYALGVLVDDVKEAMRQGIEGQLNIIYKPLVVMDEQPL